jgi:putative CocE/NonD family hydrolase
MAQRPIEKCKWIQALILLALIPSAGICGQGFDGWIRDSKYVAARDGVLLAVDTYRPTRQGQLHSERLPVVWRFTPYGRNIVSADGDTDNLPSQGGGLNSPKALETLLSNGYVVAVADIRGNGASFGVSNVWLGLQQAYDARDITDWLAGQDWSDGNIGMMGSSYLGTVQYMATAVASPHLKAIFPAMAQFDHYETFYLNGLYRPDLGVAWRRIRLALDFHGANPSTGAVAAVDADADRKLIQAAARDHLWNRDLGEQMFQMPYRDSVDSVSGKQWHIENSLWNYLDAVRESGVAIYHWTGWWDTYAKGQLLAFSNLDNPQKLHIGPYFHGDHFGIDIHLELLRWFDYWLKNIDNGIMDEPAVRYFIAGENSTDGWKRSSQWPLKEATKRVLYLTNDGLAATQEKSESRDDYDVNYGITLGTFIERNNGTFRSESCSGKTSVPEVCYSHSGYPDLSQNYDKFALSYTSDPLSEDILLVGHPVVRVWVAASSTDADLFVVLEEVETDGTSRFVTDSAIRASHRTINSPPFDHLNLPWHGHYEGDASPLPEHPVEIQLDLKPVGIRFESGNRIRLTITGADALSGKASESKVTRVIHIHHGGKYPSMIELPVINSGAQND